MKFKGEKIYCLQTNIKYNNKYTRGQVVLQLVEGLRYKPEYHLLGSIFGAQTRIFALKY
jgi:hypothetical protein